MLTPSTRLKLQAILRRIGHNESVSLSERIYVQKFADHDATVASWLRRARRMQRERVFDDRPRLQIRDRLACQCACIHKR